MFWRCSTPCRAAYRKYLLLAASYFFYASWNPKFIALLLTLTAIDFTAGIWLERTDIPAPPADDSHRQPRRQPRLSRILQVLQLPCRQSRDGAWQSRRIRSGSISCCRSGSASTPSRASLTWWMSIAANRRPSAIPSITRSSSRFFPQLVAGPIVRARDFFARSLSLESALG